MPRVQKLNVENLNSEDYAKCKSLNYRQKGDMLSTLVISRANPHKYRGRVYMIKDDSDKLLAWAIVSDGCANFYTRKSERRNGYGKQLSKAIAKDYNIWELEVGMHDKTSEAFFSGTDYKKEWC